MKRIEWEAPLEKILDKLLEKMRKDPAQLINKLRKEDLVVRSMNNVLIVLVLKRLEEAVELYILTQMLLFSHLGHTGIAMMAK
jgi:hypothetical protein